MSFDFELRLVDSAGAPARRVAEAVKTIQKNAEKAQAALDRISSKQQKGFASAFGKIGMKAEGDSIKQRQKFATAWEKIGMQMTRAEMKRKKDSEHHAGLMSGIGHAIKEETGFGKLASAAAVGTIIGEGIFKGAELLIDAAKEMVMIIGEGFKEALGASAKSQVIELGASLSLGKHGGEEFMKDLERFQGKTAFDDDVIAKMLLPLRRAGIDQQGTRSALAAALDIAAGEGQGGDQGRVEGILETLKNIRLKGGVTKKMLPTIGVDVKEFYGDLAKQLGVTADVAEKRATEGKIDPQRLLNTIYGQVEKRQGGILGTGAEAYSGTIEAKLKKLSELPEQYLKRMAKSPAFEKLGEAFSRVLEGLNPESPQGQAIVAKLEAIFSQIAGWIDQMATPEGIDRLIEGLSSALDFAKGVVSAVEAIGKAFAFCIEVANTFGQKMDDLMTGVQVAGAMASGDFAGAAKIAAGSGAASLAGGGNRSVNASVVINNHIGGEASDGVKAASDKAASDFGKQFEKLVGQAGARL